MSTPTVDTGATVASHRSDAALPQPPLIVWLDGPHSPEENMRRDGELLAAAGRAAVRGEARPPVLRLFNFRPHGVTLGHAQDPETALDLEALAAAGIPWAVRPTGGRAIFHASEWTYSMTANLDHPEWGGTLAHACARITRAIASSLQRLGVPAVVTSDAVATPRGTGSRGASNPACFATSTRHEILVEGRKLAGSAQRRTAHALLQQGSILLDDGHLRLVDYILASDARRDSLRRHLANASAGAQAYLGRGDRLETWADALLEVLPAGSRRLHGEAARMLTVSESPTYTSPVLHRDRSGL